MGYKIGSFNLRDFNFSNTVDDERIQRDISKIAQIIDEENFDVIALQEINAEIALKYLVNILNRIKSPLILICQELSEGQKIQNVLDSFGTVRDSA